MSDCSSSCDFSAPCTLMSVCAFGSACCCSCDKSWLAVVRYFLEWQRLPWCTQLVHKPLASYAVLLLYETGEASTTIPLAPALAPALALALDIRQSKRFGTRTVRAFHTGARDRSEKSALDVAVGKAYTEIADYLRNVLPDKGEHHDHCERRRGFKRAGRWMRLCRGGGYLQDLVSSPPFLKK